VVYNIRDLLGDGTSNNHLDNIDGCINHLGNIDGCCPAEKEQYKYYRYINILVRINVIAELSV
jgi:hypothetical protein